MGEPILVVDDNPTNLKLLRVLLTGQGFEVRTAMDAIEALKVLTEFTPRLILMDLQLPGMSGLELTQQLKADPKTRGIIIVALTASAMKGDEERALDAGCDGYIAKPIDTRTLPARVRQYISGAPLEAAPAEVLGLLEHMTDLKERFLIEGRQQCKALAESLEGDFDIVHARKVVHNWIGMGGSFGVGRITEIGRELSILLAQPTLPKAGLRAALEKAGAAFSG